jgi:PPM family protein phosphatase
MRKVPMPGPDKGGGPEQHDIESMFASRDAPPSAAVDVALGARSRRGRLHQVNEDHYLVIRLSRQQDTLFTSLPEDVVSARFEEHAYAMVVADGMGGTGAGEAASHLAIATLVFLVRHFSKWNLRVDNAIAREIMARTERFYRHIDNSVIYQRHHGEVATNQTTLTAAFSAGDDLFFAHVGHSRAYVCRGGQLLPLTRDHTITRRRAGGGRAPRIVPVTNAALDLKHVLTDAIGMSGPSGPDIDIERTHLEDNDRVLVCTNGLTDVVEEARIAAILASDRCPDDQCEALVDLAEASGADDDVTALVAQYRIPR